LSGKLRVSHQETASLGDLLNQFELNVLTNKAQSPRAVFQPYAPDDVFGGPVESQSSGMKSRLQFGMPLAFEFYVYISDEVTSTGDASFKKKATTAFRAFRDWSSLIMVSHSKRTLRNLPSAGVWVNKGKSDWFDRTDDVLSAYRDSRT
jgi:ABC-type polysaccharide/polyol phosphate transport system ATPase subunit